MAVNEIKINDEVLIREAKNSTLQNAGKRGRVCDKTSSGWLRVEFVSGFTKYWYRESELKLIQSSAEMS